MVAPAAHDEPAGHSEQFACLALPSAAEKLPASHRVGATEAAGQKPPALHDEQAVCPLLPWKEPATHSVHSCELALGATVPAAHGVGATAPSVQALPAGHA